MTSHPRAFGCKNRLVSPRTSARQHHKLLEVDRHRRSPLNAGCPVGLAEPAQSLAGVAQDRLVEARVVPLRLKIVRGALGGIAIRHGLSFSSAGRVGEVNVEDYDKVRVRRPRIERRAVYL